VIEYGPEESPGGPAELTAGLPPGRVAVVVTLRRCPPPLPAFLLALLLCTAARPGADGARIYEPGWSWDHPEQVRVPEAELLFEEPHAGGYRVRGFNFYCLLDDGTLLTVNVFRWLYGLLGGWGMAVLVAKPGEQVYAHEAQLQRATMGSGTERLSLHFTGGSLEGADGEYRLVLELKDFACDLRISPVLPPWMPGDGYAVLSPKGDAYTRFGVPSPWARLQGSMRLRGQWSAVTGQCYGDRTLHVYPFGKLCSPMYYFRAFSPPGTPEAQRRFLSMVVYETHPSFSERRLSMLLAAEQDRWLFTTRYFRAAPEAFRQGANSPFPCPSELHLLASKEGYRLEGAFLAGKPYHVTDVFQRLPPFFRALAGLFLKRPVVFRLGGVFQGRLTRPDGTVEVLRLPGLGEYSIVK
jgi:hypothetical protein